MSELKADPDKLDILFLHIYPVYGIFRIQWVFFIINNQLALPMIQDAIFNASLWILLTPVGNSISLYGREYL